MIEHDQDARRVSDADQTKTAETVIGVGKLIYRSYKQSPEILAFDPPTLWLVLHESYANDPEAQWLLADVNDTRAWPMAVRLAKLVHMLHEAGVLQQEPG